MLPTLVVFDAFRVPLAEVLVDVLLTHGGIARFCRWWKMSKIVAGTKTAVGAVLAAVS